MFESCCDWTAAHQDRWWPVWIKHSSLLCVRVTLPSDTHALILFRRFIWCFWSSINDQQKQKKILTYFSLSTQFRFSCTVFLCCLKKYILPTKLHFLNKKYSKFSKIVKYYFNSKQLFSMWIYCKMYYISVIKAVFSASLLQSSVSRDLQKSFSYAAQ